MKREKWQFGLIEFHSNPELKEQFYLVVKDLNDAACIVDIWVNDIKVTLEKFGYQVDIYKPSKS